MYSVDNKGFSILEILISSAIVAGLGLIVANFMVNSMKSSQGMSNQIEEIQGKQLSLKIIRKDLEQSSPSFNNLIGAQSAADFFSYLPGCPIEIVQSIQPTLELKPSGRKEVSFYIWDPIQPSPVIYLPIHAYNVGSTQISQQAASTLAYVGLNKDQIMNKMAPESWVEGKSILFYSPTWLRKDVTKPCSTASKQYPKQPAFLGRVQGSDLVKEAGLFSFADALNRNRTYVHMDDFLRRLPSVGGSAPQLFFRSVKKVTYRIAPSQNNTSKYALYRIEKEGTSQEVKFVLATGVTSLKLERKNIGETAIRVKLELSEGGI